jgi:hypothetical protein
MQQFTLFPALHNFYNRVARMQAEGHNPGNLFRVWPRIQLRFIRATSLFKARMVRGINSAPTILTGVPAGNKKRGPKAPFSVPIKKTD